MFFWNLKKNIKYVFSNTDSGDHNLLAGKVWPLASRLRKPLEIIETDTNRSATYDFILVFHILLWAYLVPFPKNGDNNAKFSHPLYLTINVRWVSFEFCNGGTWDSKN